jgi:phenylacetic acid degradation operon negative regulatory protein
VQEDWDGRWLLVLARVPDAARADGQKLRTRLRWAGLGSPTPGVWASTHVDRRVAVETAIADANLGSETHIFISEHVGGAQLSAMVRQAWDLEAIEQSYKKFLLDFQVETTSEPLERLVRLAHAWRRLAMIDPALPLELLPAEWDGVEAAERFHRLHAAWRDEARAQWKALPQ